MALWEQEGKGNEVDINWKKIHECIRAKVTQVSDVAHEPLV
jgi:hypothetical protein